MRSCPAGSRAHQHARICAQVFITYGDESTSNVELLDQCSSPHQNPAVPSLPPLPTVTSGRHSHPTLTLTLALTAPQPWPPARYGFVDISPEMIAADQALLRRHPDSVAALQASSIAEDVSLLEAGSLSPKARLAVQLRLQLKRARDAASLTD